ncbi:MAG: methyltransferase domain-containing protein [Treponema sp.]|jgi:trans-aconitate methyltransferase|nr:methyltransferase domain-containing protein [Treponema sp.]
MEAKKHTANSQDFTTISKRYKEISLLQSSAAEILFSLLNIQNNENVLDIGCGTGNLTKKIYDISKGNVVGIDPAKGMIEESRKHYGNLISFEENIAENITYENKFNVIFCNSAFQWVKNQEMAVGKFYTALKNNGRIGIQAPAKKVYCPNFIDAVNKIKGLKTIKNIFNKFNDPWNFFETAEEYSNLFRKKGFEVPFSKIQTIETYNEPEEVYKIFCSGAIAGYLNNEYYDCEINEKYTQIFLENIREAFIGQAEYNGKVKLIFNRIFLIGIKK